MVDFTAKAVIEVGHHQMGKQGQVACGDVFRSRLIKNESRVISVLSDGLGSGIKASVLATLTTSMALKFTASDMDMRAFSEIIMDTLPICRTRKISYSTFTIVDMNRSGKVRVLEHGNPPVSLWSGTRERAIYKQTLQLPKWKDREIQFSEFQMNLGERLIFFSDGISQAGMGRPAFPLGWGSQGVATRVAETLARGDGISAPDLARDLVGAAARCDGGAALDDITCGVHFYREPRRLLVVTGPPFEKERDGEVAQWVDSFSGKKAICGGTTSNLVAAHLGRLVETEMDFCAPGIPPGASMEGVDLITEGTLTLSVVAALLEGDHLPPPDSKNPALCLLHLLLESDLIAFVVGTRMNEAHQDPSIPMELDLRRNIVRRMVALLENKYCKETQLVLV